jgi:membrane-associated phospholipid phosphatase
MLKTIGEFDRQAMGWMLRHRNRFATPILQALTVTAWGGTWAVVVISLYLAIRLDLFPYQRSLLVDFLQASIAPGAAWLMVSAIKRRWKRKRPFQAIEGYAALTWSSLDDSFPSGHAASAFAFLTMLAGTRPELLPFVGAWATSIAFSRLYLGVHFPSDIAIGGLVGAIIGSSIRIFGLDLFRIISMPQ